MNPGSDTYEDGVPNDMLAENIGGLVIFFGALFLVSSIGALIGGFAALRRQSYAKAVTGAVMGIFAVGFGLGIILSIIALVFLVLANDEFGDNGNGLDNRYGRS